MEIFWLLVILNSLAKLVTPDHEIPNLLKRLRRLKAYSYKTYAKYLPLNPHFSVTSVPAVVYSSCVATQAMDTLRERYSVTRG